MMDFVSTRPGTRPDVAACARLLSAVIASAVHDACKPATTEEKRNAQHVDHQARAAIDFLFGEDSVFPLYADLIGTSADALRAALRDAANSPLVDRQRGVGAMERRTLLERLRRRASAAH